ncbi:MAG: ATP phosphoribosyltransferase [Rickettsiales bacterium]|nr:ATP phosphoribosyltransferase [Rickettsiales bacterium]
MSGLVIAVPKGRIQDELAPLFRKVGIYPEESFFDDSERSLQFRCKDSDITLIRVRSFDVPTFVAFGAAHMGIAGSDVLMEFDYPDLYAPLNLDIGHCRLSVAQPYDMGEEDFAGLSHIRVATKYPNLTRKYFADQGVQAECIKLNGAMELAPRLGLAKHIVDLVSSGRTLKANGLREVKVIAEISSRLIVNRAAFKTRSGEVSELVERFRELLDEEA